MDRFYCDQWIISRVKLRIFCLFLIAIFLVGFLIRIYQCEFSDRRRTVNENEEKLLLKTMLQKIQPQNHSKNNAVLVKSRQARSADMGWKLSADDAKAVFRTYELCLMRRNYRSQTSVKAILALEGQSVTMTCNLCRRPDQDPDTIKVDWQRMRANDAVVQYVNPSSRVRIDHGTRDLIFEAVDVLDAGQYYCVDTFYREYEEVYQLDVLFQERRRIVDEQDSNTLLKDFFLTDLNLMTFTLWSEWSDCNQCGKVGTRRKIGLCMVNKIDKNQPVKPRDLPILTLYPEGVPCRSTVLPSRITMVKRISLRRSETLMGKCFITCPTTPAFVLITDSTGKVIETVEAGFYSLKDKPTIPPIVIRRVVYEEAGKHLILQCPGQSEGKSLIRWQNGTVVLNPQTIRRQTRGRVFTDTINRLHIRSTRLYDSAPYNCWLGKRHVATVKVVITKALNRNLKDYITYAGLLTTIISVCLICVCVCKSKGKKTSK